MPFTIVRQDITKLKVDAIVNAANTDLAMGGGVCGAIFKAAGALELQAACDKLAPIKTGEAVITPGFGLRAKFIIHASGPVYSQRNKEQNEQLLRAAYTNSLKRAVENNCISIAFPLISSGIYGYPKDEALQVATSAIQDFLKDYDLEVTLVVFDKSSFAVSRELLGAVESYIDEHFFEKHQIKRRQLLDAEKGALEEALEEEGIFSPKILESMQAPLARAGIDDFVDNLDEPFSMTLLRLIDAKGKTDVEIYKRANLDRKLFSKIRTSRNYMPSKRTAVGLAIALELSLDETEDLLERAGYALSHSQKFDVIVEYFIVSGKYDIFEINEVLFKYDQPLLGG
ncbi:MAG TPA: macro domain-containing protein [Saccharofermentans sp.]|nr:macro domain-containing protein [Clostridiaceae bacterium]HOO49470.1 macro domain-containing protein [Saccharofermentans sp.]HPE28029.1 macro domain-containing protein [Saccharofermentans sp.]HPQ32698.1 macro domain-containing protein [Saccharofermentans sp.]